MAQLGRLLLQTGDLNLTGGQAIADHDDQVKTMDDPEGS